jgi:hypothetical protein
VSLRETGSYSHCLTIEVGELQITNDETNTYWPIAWRDFSCA